jgi:hypothetical protein
MNSIKCPECGLVNFATARKCKRCHFRFHQTEPEKESSQPGKPQVPKKRATEIQSPLSEAPGETAEVEPEASSAPLPEYFDDEPLPFSKTVILFAVNLALSVLVCGYQLKVCVQFMGSDIFKSARDPALGPEYLRSLEPFMYMELMVKTVELLAAIALLFLLSGKFWSFLKWARIYLVAGLLYQIIEIAAVLYLRSALAARDIAMAGTTAVWKLTELPLRIGLLVAGASILLRLIWLAYFNTSERVRKIFIN